MNCLYCAQTCQFIELDDILGKVSENWKCTNCPHTVRYSNLIGGPKDNLFICIQLKYAGKVYAAHFYNHYDDNDLNYCQIVEIDAFKKKDHIDFNIIVIAELSGHPNITPSNIENKLPIYITFS